MNPRAKRNAWTHEHQDDCISWLDFLLADFHRLSSDAHISSTCGESLSFEHVIADALVVIFLYHVLDLSPNLDVFRLEEKFHTFGEL